MNEEYKNIVWHPHTESPNETCRVLVRIESNEDESSSKYKYYVWTYIKDSKTTKFFDSNSFYIIHTRYYTTLNVCLPGDGQHRYSELRTSDNQMVCPDYEWAYLE